MFLTSYSQRAKDLDVRVMVDAEQTYFQPAISRLTLEMMKKYNTEKTIVFNTYQASTLTSSHSSTVILIPSAVLSQGGT
jgi:protoheme ferro-lyase